MSNVFWSWLQGINSTAPLGNYVVNEGSDWVQNTPGARQSLCAWQHDDGSLYIFGGIGLSGISTSFNNLNDMWRYDPASNLWSFIKGSSVTNATAVYGKIGVADTRNVPGARQEACCWKGNNGKFYLFGGLGMGETPSITAGLLNDLWEFDPATKNWTWIKGGTANTGAGSTGALGIYGTRLVETTTNQPGARQQACCWTGADGRLYLFGGNGISSTTQGSLNDLWCFNLVTKNWTWLKGANTPGQGGVYNTINIASDTNLPGARQDACCWTGADGNLYLFGGIDSSSNLFNDMWQFNPSNLLWTWIKGASTSGAGAVYVSDIIALNPGARQQACCWTGSGNQLYLFGGRNASGSLNDLWSFDTVSKNWVWLKGANTTGQPGVYGVQGISNLANTPGARINGASMGGSSGFLYLFAGTGLGTDTTSNLLNDLWRYDILNNAWTWLKGSHLTLQLGIYGQGSNAGSFPGGRETAAIWCTSDGAVYLFGGLGTTISSTTASIMNDMWRYDPTDQTWTWVHGGQVADLPGVYGTRLSDSIYNVPGARRVSSYCQDKDGNFYLFGGLGRASSGGQGLLNDLWRFNPVTKTWAWISGPNTPNGLANYGIFSGLPSSDTKPGARSGSYSFVGLDGKVYLFGGNGKDMANNTTGVLNDLWQFNPSNGQWKWIKGANMILQSGNYGTLKVPAISNFPGSRHAGCSWQASDGQQYIFGGIGLDNSATSTTSTLNDLWRFNPTDLTWTWIKGSNTGGGLASGALGVVSDTNTPSARQGGCFWTGLDGNFYLFGGSNNTFLPPNANSQDLWQFNPVTNNWLWIGGTTNNTNGTYGAPGVPATTNLPGSRAMACCWTGLDGHLYMFGGNGQAGSGGGLLNDLWRYRIATSDWTWIGGRSDTASLGTYGPLGLASVTHLPAARYGACCWRGFDGHLYMFGGSASNTTTSFNDMWRYRIATSDWTWLGGSSSALTNKPGIYGTQGVADINNIPGARQMATCWVGSDQNLYLFGGTGIDAVGNNTAVLNDLWRYNITTNMWTWLGGSPLNTVNIHGIYGLIQCVPSDINIPGGRSAATCWMGSDDKIYIFGGVALTGSNAISSGLINDLWCFDLKTMLWQWLAGANHHSYTNTNCRGIGIRGVPSVVSTPSGRSMAAGFIGKDNKIYLFGGSGTDALGNGAATLNDTWVFDPSTHMWTWINGHNRNNGQTGIYGTPSDHPLAEPGCRQEVCGWQGKDGKFYVFGGLGIDNIGNANSSMNDLWRFDPATKNWTWVKGAHVANQFSIFTAKNVPAAINTPGARQQACYWEGSDGKLYVFGGTGFPATPALGGGFMNDLWAFDTDTQQWTFIKGDDSISQNGRYNTFNVASDNNQPGGRGESSFWRIGNTLYVFGGIGFPAAVPGVASTSNLLNDLWSFDVNTQRWKWIKGCDKTLQAIAPIGTVSTSDIQSTPGARWDTAYWTSGGKFYVFGGAGFGGYPTANGGLNDLWVFTPDTSSSGINGTWQFIKGSTGINQLGNFGTKGVPSSNNFPSARNRAHFSTGSNGSLYLFGGGGNLNDLWRFDTVFQQWTWLSGSQLGSQNGVYGPLGSDGPLYVPGGRNNGAFWTGIDGNLYLFGGFGLGISGSTSSYMNDMWRYNTVTNTWAWLKGSSSTGQSGIYVSDASALTPGARSGIAAFWSLGSDLYLFGGTNVNNFNDLWRYNIGTNNWTYLKGSQTAGNTNGIYTSDVNANVPGQRVHSMFWTGSDGNLYLFGGLGNAVGNGRLNDLWCYNPQSNIWTWIGGTTATNSASVYGRFGVRTSTNLPGGREHGAGFYGPDNRFYLFGGSTGGTDATSLNDMWRYDLAFSDWVWIKGTTTAGALGVYGQSVPSVQSVPGARNAMGCFVGSDGQMYLFAGFGFDVKANADRLNDLWRFNPTDLTWQFIKGNTVISQLGRYGTINLGQINNQPGSRQDFGVWTGSDGQNFYVFGGQGYPSTGTTVGILNDLWNYNTLTNTWTWLSGSDGIGQIGNYGTQGTSATTNMPGARQKMCCWVGKDGLLYLFGGNNGAASANFNDLWRFDPSNGMWVWLRGLSTIGTTVTSATINTPSTSDVNSPGQRSSACCWTGLDGYLYLFGGTNSGAISGTFNDLWRYRPDVSDWTWLKGSAITAGQSGVYGAQGVPDALNTPGARYNACCWTSSDGQLYLFGGTTGSGDYNDLWRYRISDNTWVWLKGGNTVTQTGIYTSDIFQNTPGSRNQPTGCVGKDGMLYLFGGISGSTRFNDTWRYDTGSNIWTWIQGAATPGARGVYHGPNSAFVSSTSAMPGSRQQACHCVGKDGNLYLFGGTGIDINNASSSPLNDLWQFNPNTNNWTWVRGDVNNGQTGLYNKQNTPHPNNKPGARVNASLWTGYDGQLYLFGGANGGNFFNDLWRYNLNTNMWTWLTGSNAQNASGTYGTQNVPSVLNTPGGRSSAASWVGSDSRLYVFGGNGRGSNTSGANVLNDLWAYNISDGTWTWLKGYDDTGKRGIYSVQIGTSGSYNNPGARSVPATWTANDGTTYISGGIGLPAAGSLNVTGSFLNDFWSYDTNTQQWQYITGSTSVPTGVLSSVADYTNIYYGQTQRPSARCNTGFCYNPATGCAYMFGGSGIGGAAVSSLTGGTLNDLWVWHLDTPCTTCTNSGNSNCGSDVLHSITATPVYAACCIDHQYFFDFNLFSPGHAYEFWFSDKQLFASDIKVFVNCSDKNVSDKLVVICE